MINVSYLTAPAARSICNPILKFVTLLFAFLGLCGLHAETTGYFTVKKIEGRWWIISPKGELFISKGVTTIDFAQDTIQGTSRSPYRETNLNKYGSPDVWRRAAAQRLMEWNFNSLGAWSDSKVSSIDVGGRHLAYAPIINIGAAFVKEKAKGNGSDIHAWLHGIFPDVFDPDFVPFARALAKKECTPRANDTAILGWFTDNEMRWGPDWRSKDDLIISFLNNPINTPGRNAAIDLLKKHYASIADFNAVWKTSFKSWEELATAEKVSSPFPRKEVYHQNQEVENQLNAAEPNRAKYIADCDAFLNLLAEYYFKTVTEAIHAADPNHMVFGCRFAYVPGQQVVDAAARWLDVISFNKYDFDPTDAVIKYSVFQKPLIIGEFGFRGADSGLPNTQGAGPVVKTQADRAASFRNYVQKLMASPYVVGYHWFEHADEPAEGRFDGENSNYGVVNIHDEPYKDLVSVMTEVNAAAEAWHKAAPAIVK